MSRLSCCSNRYGWTNECLGCPLPEGEGLSGGEVLQGRCMICPTTHRSSKRRELHEGVSACTCQSSHHCGAVDRARLGPAAQAWRDIACGSDRGSHIL